MPEQKAPTIWELLEAVRVCREGWAIIEQAERAVNALRGVEDQLKERRAVLATLDTEVSTKRTELERLTGEVASRRAAVAAEAEALEREVKTLRAGLKRSLSAL